jgi:hypothetical protein
MAQGYQESQLNQSKHSPRGAVGIMQMLPSTARDKAIGISGIEKDPDRNVEAGTKYLRHLIATYIDDQDLQPKDRQLFAFAAYNAGPANLQKFREKAKAMGLDPNVWFGNVENGASEIVGRETVQYVSNICKYYIAYSLLVKRMEEHTGAILRGDVAPLGEAVRPDDCRSGQARTLRAYWTPEEVAALVALLVPNEAECMCGSLVEITGAQAVAQGVLNGDRCEGDDTRVRRDRDDYGGRSHRAGQDRVSRHPDRPVTS